MGNKKNIWNRNEDGNRKEQRSFLRYAIVATAIMAVFLFVKKDNVIRWIQAGITLDRQQKKIEQLEQQNATLEQNITEMSTNRDTLEKYARETFGFAAPGEDVYIDE